MRNPTCWVDGKMPYQPNLDAETEVKRVLESNNYGFGTTGNGVILILETHYPKMAEEFYDQVHKSIIKGVEDGSIIATDLNSNTGITIPNNIKGDTLLSLANVDYTVPIILDQFGDNLDLSIPLHDILITYMQSNDMDCNWDSIESALQQLETMCTDGLLVSSQTLNLTVNHNVRHKLGKLHRVFNTPMKEIKEMKEMTGVTDVGSYGVKHQQLTLNEPETQKQNYFPVVNRKRQVPSNYLTVSVPVTQPANIIVPTKPSPSSLLSTAEVHNESVGDNKVNVEDNNKDNNQDFDQDVDQYDERLQDKEDADNEDNEGNEDNERDEEDEEDEVEMTPLRYPSERGRFRSNVNLSSSPFPSFSPLGLMYHSGEYNGRSNNTYMGREYDRRSNSENTDRAYDRRLLEYPTSPSLTSLSPSSPSRPLTRRQVYPNSVEQKYMYEYNNHSDDEYDNDNHDNHDYDSVTSREREISKPSITSPPSASSRSASSQSASPSTNSSSMRRRSNQLLTALTPIPLSSRNSSNRSRQVEYPTVSDDVESW